MTVDYCHVLGTGGDAGVRLLTLGQYLQPSLKQIAVVRYLPVEEFQALGKMARQIGFTQVASGPFVRSSYHARDMAVIEGFS